MKLRKLRIGKCTVEVNSSNSVKPKTEKARDGSLNVTPRCVCGATFGTYTLTDRTNKIIETALEDKARAEAKGRRPVLSLVDFSSIDEFCSSCGRPLHVKIQWHLTSKWLKNLNKQRKHAREVLLYGDCLEVSVEIKGGHFTETRQRRLISELLNPVCACGVELNPLKLREAFERIVSQINTFWEEGTPVEPISLEAKEKCAFCLYMTKIKVGFTPKLPTKNSTIPQIIAKHSAWQKRMLT